ncbi:class I tRNA ligase family protein, partial [Bradyrhizobium mercantei]|uniref:class I tRNA ligase family protein n=1 Tax=Bradyrhizobium mercantei TaxID=1904807 RepID=UPI001AEC73FC
ARLFVMFASPPEQTLEWSDSGVEGSNRFLRRLWSISYAQRDTIARGLAAGADWSGAPAAVKDLRREVYNLLKQADYDYQRIQYNTVVSACMKMLNAIDDAKLPEGAHADAAYAETLGVLLRVLYPVVPHITWHLWRDLGYANELGDLLDAPTASDSEAGPASRAGSRRRRWRNTLTVRRRGQVVPEEQARRLDQVGPRRRRDYDYQRIQYNTVVSACMKMLNA